jgi:PleD family two-component response regulator
MNDNVTFPIIQRAQEQLADPAANRYRGANTDSITGPKNRDRFGVHLLDDGAALNAVEWHRAVQKVLRPAA